MRARHLNLICQALLLVCTLANADIIKMYDRTDRALAARLMTFSAAQRTIDIMAYELRPCDSSIKLVLGVLAERARRGVRVRLLLDAYLVKSEEREYLARYLDQHGIQLKLYNDSKFIITKNHRSHVKIAIIDGHTYLTASSNLSDDYFGVGKQINFHNRDFLIQGASAAQAQKAFDKIWALKISKSAKVKPGTARSGLAQCEDLSRTDRVVADYFNKNAQKLVKAKAHSCARIRVDVDDPDFRNAAYDGERSRGNGFNPYMTRERLKRKRATASILEFISGAKSSLNMENQYYLAQNKLRQELDQARRRRVPTVIFTSLMVDAASGMSDLMSYLTQRSAKRDSKGSLSVVEMFNHGGFNGAYELTPRTPWYVHSKTAVRNHRDVWFGSFNLDPRSSHTNLEFGVTVKGCPSLAQALETRYRQMFEIYKDDLKNCRECGRKKPDVNALQIFFGLIATNFL